MDSFFFRHKEWIRRIGVFLLLAVFGLLIVAQLAAFGAAQIFSYAVNEQHMLHGTITVEKISADIAGYVSFENLLWNDEEGHTILSVPDGKIKVRPWDILRGKLRATAISEIKLNNAALALQFDENMNVDLINREIGEERQKKDPATLEERISNFTHTGQKIKMNIHLNNCRMEAFYAQRRIRLSHVNMHMNINTEDAVFIDLSSGKFGGTAIGDSMTLYGDVDMKDAAHSISMDIAFNGVDPSSLGLGDDIHDKLTLTAEAYGPLAHPKAKGHISMKELHIPALDFSQVEGDVSYHRGNMDFTNVTGRVYGGELEARGNYNLDSRKYDIYLKGKDLDARYPAQDAQLSCLVDVNGEIHCEGTSQPVVSSGSFFSGGGRYKLIPFNNISGTFHNKGKELDFYDVSIDTPFGTFSTDAFHIRNGKVQLGDIHLTDDAGQQTEVRSKLAAVGDTFKKIRQDVSEIRQQISDMQTGLEK